MQYNEFNLEESVTYGVQGRTLPDGRSRMIPFSEMDTSTNPIIATEQYVKDNSTTKADFESSQNKQDLEIVELFDDIKALNHETEELDVRVTKLEKGGGGDDPTGNYVTKEDFESSQTQQDEHINSLETNDKRQDEGIENLLGYTGDLYSRTDKLDKKVIETDKVIGKLDVRVTKNESKIDALETKIDDVSTIPKPTQDGSVLSGYSDGSIKWTDGIRTYDRTNTPYLRDGLLEVGEQPPFIQVARCATQDRTIASSGYTKGSLYFIAGGREMTNAGSTHLYGAGYTVDGELPPVVFGSYSTYEAVTHLSDFVIGLRPNASEFVIRETLRVTPQGNVRINSELNPNFADNDLVTKAYVDSRPSGGDTSALEAQIKALQDRIADLESKSTTNTNDIKTLNTQMKSTSTAVGTNTKDIKSLTTRVSNLETKVDSSVSIHKPNANNVVLRGFANGSVDWRPT